VCPQGTFIDKKLNLTVGEINDRVRKKLRPSVILGKVESGRESDTAVTETSSTDSLVFLTDTTYGLYTSEDSINSSDSSDINSDNKEDDSKDSDTATYGKDVPKSTKGSYKLYQSGYSIDSRK